MRIKSVLVLVRDVGNAQHVQLFLITTACDIDGKKHRPGDNAADEKDAGRNFQVTQKEESIQGVMVQDVAVGDLADIDDPFEKPARHFRRALSKMMASVCAASLPKLLLTVDGEIQDMSGVDNFSSTWSARSGREG